MKTAAEHPAPTFPHHAYGVDLTWFGEDGGMIARGHVPDLRFIAACNHLARVEMGLRNIWDDQCAALDEALPAIERRWVVPADPGGIGYECEWAVTWHGVTDETPGAIPVTVLDP